MDDLASVVENVVEHSSWEESRRGCKCRFPPKGGLHHTSGDASLEMHLKIPNWCYAYKSQSPSSRRTRAAAAEYRIVSQIHRGHSTNHMRCISMNCKRFKQRNYLRKVKSRKVASLNIQCLLIDFIKNNIVVCNGGNDKLRPWIYNAYWQTLSRTILLSAMGVMITNVYCPHPWTQHGIVFEYATGIFGWLTLWILTLDFGTPDTMVNQYLSIYQG